MTKFSLKNVLNRLRKIQHDKRGSLSIEIMIGAIVFFIVLLFLIDLIVLLWKFSVISQTTTNIARTSGIQGGILSSAPSSFPGGNDAYINSTDMYNKLNSIFNNAGIETADWSVTINGVKLTSNKNIKIQYGGNVFVETKVDYEWTFISNLIPGQITQSVTSQRMSMSEYKYRYDTWIGE